MCHIRLVRWKASWIIHGLIDTYFPLHSGLIFFTLGMHASSPPHPVRVCPIFQVSNVTGENLDLLKSFVNLLTARMPPNCDKPAEFQIDETYYVPVSC